MALPIAPFILLIPALIVRTDRRLIKDLRQANATSAERAVPLPGSVLRRMRTRRMTTAGALAAVDGDRYYLIESGWNAYRAARRKRAAIVISISLGLLYLGYALIF